MPGLINFGGFVTKEQESKYYQTVFDMMMVLSIRVQAALKKCKNFFNYIYN